MSELSYMLDVTLDLREKCLSKNVIETKQFKICRQISVYPILSKMFVMLYVVFLGASAVPVSPRLFAHV
jgi:hypothetical protein